MSQDENHMTLGPQFEDPTPSYVDIDPRPFDDDREPREPRDPDTRRPEPPDASIWRMLCEIEVLGGSDARGFAAEDVISALLTRAGAVEERRIARRSVSASLAKAKARRVYGRAGR